MKYVPKCKIWRWFGGDDAEGDSRAGYDQVIEEYRIDAESDIQACAAAKLIVTEESFSREGRDYPAQAVSLQKVVF